MSDLASTDHVTQDPTLMSVTADELFGLIDDEAEPMETENAPPGHVLESVEELDATGDEDRARRKEERRRIKREEKRRRRERGGESEEDSEGEDGSGKKHRKEKKSSKKKRSSNPYIDDAAESGEESEEADDATHEIPDDPEVAYIKNYKRRVHMFEEGENEKTPEEIAAEIVRRAELLRRSTRTVSLTRRPGSSRAPVIPQHESYEMRPIRIPPSARLSTAFLPRPTDPKVFAVKCKPGMPRILVTRIVNKCYHYRIGKNDEEKKVDLGIISVFALDHVKEYIYIESYRQGFVENTLNGLVGVFRYNIHVVDPSELLRLVEHRPKQRANSGAESIKVGDFVRVKSTPSQYRGDLAVVLEKHEEGKRSTIRLIPREDVAKPYAKPQASVRHPQKFFDPNVAVGVHGNGDRYRWGDLLFDGQGYLLLTVATRNLIFGDQMMRPSTEELTAFYKGRKNDVTYACEMVAAARASVSGAPKMDLRLGEPVRVVAGTLAGAIGTIVDVTVSSNTVKISCAIPGRPTPIELRTELSFCTRHFVMGDRVGVESGAYAGSMGTVIQASGDVVRVLRDESQEEIEALAADCRLVRFVSAAKHTVASWRMFDLIVLVDGVTIGCVVRCSTASLTVVTSKNLAKEVALGEIKAAAKTLSQGRMSAIDRMQNVVKRGDEVIIKEVGTSGISPMLLDTTAIVEQTFLDYLFVRSSRVFENSGILAIEAGCVQKMGGRTTMKHIAAPKQLPMPEKRSHYATRATDQLAGRSLAALAAETQRSAEWDVASAYLEVDH